ncbi:MAG: hypothetical protein HQK77_13750 [Desulfobacterales bacterium]|nr:hypothetical protein [Desulfobacterales bacterium]
MTESPLILLLYNLARGPLVWISGLIFIMGVIYQCVSMYKLTQKQIPFMKASQLNDPDALKFDIKQTVLYTHPVMTVVTSVFHMCLIIIPLFLLAHNILLDQSIGFSLLSFSENISDFLTMIYCVCAFIFLFRRIFLKRVRIISTFYDYVIWFLASAPFITGFLAYHQLFNYFWIVTLHMILGELMIIAIPFTKFAHMIYFIIFRFFVVNEYSLRRLQATRTF